MCQEHACLESFGHKRLQTRCTSKKLPEFCSVSVGTPNLRCISQGTPNPRCMGLCYVFQVCRLSNMTAHRHCHSGTRLTTEVHLVRTYILQGEFTSCRRTCSKSRAADDCLLGAAFLPHTNTFTVCTSRSLPIEVTPLPHICTPRNAKNVLP